MKLIPSKTKRILFKGKVYAYTEICDKYSNQISNSLGRVKVVIELTNPWNENFGPRLNFWDADMLGQAPSLEYAPETNIVCIGEVKVIKEVDEYIKSNLRG